ncbi:HTH-type transcriptional regulator ArgP [Paraburkholderia sp. USG1]|uniref:HTH-type transcriptional regulator ArgP n=1 Tax=Paraburkholderia sp. USG1 TaxID=2952268 RepID=UPI002860D306|nr:HTH-type transcriptional regulator ArgP [Paraburkholderia sp. USG1]MDR8398416.1 HTH-type transcriptional regulator ArgP [Paraburkholderia sp. USG1]
MLDRQQLETFATVVQQQHFRRAAAALNISPGAVSQRIKSLEEAVGAMLLMREPMIAPTQAGEEILRYIMAVRLLEDDALQHIKPDRFPPVDFAIAVNADSLATWFEPVAWELARQHVSLEIIVDDQDHTLTALARGDVKGCISTQRKPLVGFAAELVGGMRYHCVATPEFIAEHLARGLVLPDVLKIPAILFNRKDALHDSFLASFFRVTVGAYPKHYFPSSTALLDAIHNALGYGLVPAMQAEPLISSGKFVNLAPAHSLVVDLYWHHWESEPAPAASISQLVMEQARRCLIQASPEGDEAGNV